MAGKLPGASHLLRVWVLGKAISWVLGNSLRNSATEHHPPFEVGTSSNAILTTPHSQLNVHLMIKILDLYSH